MVSNDELLKQIQVQTQTMELIQKEINENINQILFVVRLKLATIDLVQKDQTLEYLQQSGILIGQAIGDLRNLANRLNNLGTTGPVKSE